MDFGNHDVLAKGTGVSEERMAKDGESLTQIGAIRFTG